MIARGRSAAGTHGSASFIDPEVPSPCSPLPLLLAPRRAPERRPPPGGGLPSFADLGLAEPLLRVLDRAGFPTPFPIQAATLPDALVGCDVLGRGQTGSGKTLAFGLAMLSRLAGGPPPACAPRGLVLVPTRELATQVVDALQPFAASLRLRAAAVVGGTSFVRQADALRRGVDLLVATPGRLSDHVRRAAASSPRSPSPPSMRRTGWPTWASCRRSARSST